MQKVLLVGAWFFGVIFIFGSLGAFLEGSLIAGLLMLFAGILFLPPIKRLILDKKPNLSKGKITVAGAILGFISLFFLPLDAELTDEKQDLTSESAAVKTEQNIVKSKPTTEPESATEVVEKSQAIDIVDEEQAKINKIMEVGITLGITPEEYGKRFNEIIKPAGLKETNWSKRGLKLNEGDYLDTFVVDYPHDLVLVGAVDKNGDLKSLEYQIGTSAISGNADNIAMLLSVLAGASTKVLNPELSEDEAFKFAANFIGDAATNFGEKEVSQRDVKIMGNNAYMTEANQFMVTFRIEPEASDNHKD